ncbi:isochorismatase family protein [Pelistega sp. NLN82]|uniref:Isochorismatase family protein n=1 Tax=Pelistega ratti TaxID=2652177 RepID=A0A6L9Y5F1_9BURK|nr:isochorismatase family protein [Pelistega ratti]NEN75147.1 isochorismatase family protein [Pelistega ratti]
MLLKPEESIVIMVDIQEKLMPVMHRGDSVIQSAEALLQAATLLNIPVMTTEHYPDKIGATVIPLQPYRGTIITKKTFSAAKEPLFVQTLAEISQKTNRHQLIVIGVESHICVLQTLIELEKTGQYHCHLVVDATSSRKVSDKTIALERAKEAGISLITTEMAIFEWAESGEHPHFRALSKLIKNLSD